MWLTINIILILVIIAMFAYPYINKFRIKSVAKIVDNAAFSEQIVGGQLIDLRESSAFRIIHILCARNLPFSQFLIILPKEPFQDLKFLLLILVIFR